MAQVDGDHWVACHFPLTETKVDAPTVKGASKVTPTVDVRLLLYGRHDDAAQHVAAPILANASSTPSMPMQLGDERAQREAFRRQVGWSS
ncbi:MAG: hypothetical protein R2704_03060 [Microthrixaceae bacterium]